MTVTVNVLMVTVVPVRRSEEIVKASVVRVTEEVEVVPPSIWSSPVMTTSRLTVLVRCAEVKVVPYVRQRVCGEDG